MRKQFYSGLLLATVVLAGCQAGPTAQSMAANVEQASAMRCSQGQRLQQTTLWFGLTRPQATAITEPQWQQFIDQQVTPRFREGLSIYQAQGQWLGRDGVITHEPSKALMLIHAPGAENDRKIEQIRQIYQQRFAQESVMRVDNAVCVDF